MIQTRAKEALSDYRVWNDNSGWLGLEARQLPSGLQRDQR